MPDFGVLLDASPAIKFHLVTIVVCVLLLVPQFLVVRGSPAHRRIGRVWVVLMALSALSTFAIHEINQFGRYSAVHGLSLWVLFSLGYAVVLVRKGHTGAHRRTMLSIIVFGLGIAGGLTFLPGRMMHEMFF